MAKFTNRQHISVYEDDYFKMLSYGYLTVIVAVLCFSLYLLGSYYLIRHSELYFQTLKLYLSCLHGFVRTVLIIIISVTPLWLCQLYSKSKPIISILLFFIAVILLGFPLAIPILFVPELVIPTAIETIVLTLLFCSIGIFLRKNLSKWQSLLAFSLGGLVITSLLNVQFFHLNLLSSLLTYAGIIIFIGYLIFDANNAMLSYVDAKELGGLFWISILLANSLDIFQDIIVLFFELLSTSDSDSSDSGGFDSFW